MKKKWKKKFRFRKKQLRLRNWYRNWTLVSVPDTETELQFQTPKPNFSLTLDKNPQNIRSAPSKSKTEVAPSNRHTMHSVVVRKNLLKGVWNQVNQNHLLLNLVLCFEIKLGIKEKSSKFAVQPIQVYLFEF